MSDLVIFLLLPIVLLVIFLIVGHMTEGKHLKSLAAREPLVADLTVTTLKRPCGQVLLDKPPTVVCGEAVIASDGFKSWLFGLKNMVGGESKTFVRLFDRARREATLRMLESAKAQGYNAVCNVRFGGTDIGGNTSAGGKRANQMAVCLVSGTAYLMTE